MESCDALIRCTASVLIEVFLYKIVQKAYLMCKCTFKYKITRTHVVPNIAVIHVGH